MALAARATVELSTRLLINMLRLKTRVKRLVEDVFRVRIYSQHPHGRDDCHDIAASGIPIRTIFDVGAHQGSSVLKFRDAFPDASIDSFEPVKETFTALQANVSHLAHVRCHPFALGSHPGEAPIYKIEHSTASSLVRPDWFADQEMVTVNTLDTFVAEMEVTQIDLLKIDAEGYDLEVLRGAHGTLAAGKVTFVLVEVTFSRGETRFPLFDDVRDLLSVYGFTIFGIYDQERHWSERNRLWYVNACFVSPRAGGRALPHD
jgi:FkbM family methyltransferase